MLHVCVRANSLHSKRKADKRSKKCAVSEFKYSDVQQWKLTQTQFKYKDVCNDLSLVQLLCLLHYLYFFNMYFVITNQKLSLLNTQANSMVVLQEKSSCPGLLYSRDGLSFLQQNPFQQRKHCCITSSEKHSCVNVAYFMLQNKQ